MYSDPEPRAGVHLLETITRGMYKEPLHSIREYIQNAFDSIREARRLGMLCASEGEIRLSIDKTGRTLRIHDKGIGLSPEAAAVYLQDIGRSEKAQTPAGLKRNAGFRGIGRMAGISYCRTLLFETSNGDGRNCTVKFDAAGLRQLMVPGQQPPSMIEAIKEKSQIIEGTAELGHHYFEVVLDGVDSNSPLLDEDKLRDYLAQVAPVKCDRTVWRFESEINTIAQNSGGTISLNCVGILICDMSGNIRMDIRRPFKNSFMRADSGDIDKRTLNVERVVPLPLDGRKAHGWWGWLAVHELVGQLRSEASAFAGLRVRMHNIAIGGEGIIRNLFVTPSHATWCFGEIHITNPKLVPNAQRDDFEPSNEWEHIRWELKAEAKKIGQRIRRESKHRNLIKRVRKAINDAGQIISSDATTGVLKDNTLQNLGILSKKLKATVRAGDLEEQHKTVFRKILLELDRMSSRVKAVRVSSSSPSHKMALRARKSEVINTQRSDEETVGTRPINQKDTSQNGRTTKWQSESSSKVHEKDSSGLTVQNEWPNDTIPALKGHEEIVEAILAALKQKFDPPVYRDIKGTIIVALKAKGKE